MTARKAKQDLLAMLDPREKQALLDLQARLDRLGSQAIREPMGPLVQRVPPEMLDLPVPRVRRVR